MINVMGWTSICFRSTPSTSGKAYGGANDVTYESQCVDGVYVGP